MNSRTTEDFRRLFAKLPARVQQQARSAYRRFLQDPHHPGLQLKPVHPRDPIYSARVGSHYRAVGILDGNTIIRFWIGSHADYDALLAQW